MKKQQWVDRVMASNNDNAEKIRKLDAGCIYYITAGKCNGKNGNCSTCPLTIAKRVLIGKKLVGKKQAPKEPTTKTTVMFKSKNITFNWIEQ